MREKEGVNGMFELPHIWARIAGSCVIESARGRFDGSTLTGQVSRMGLSEGNRRRRATRPRLELRRIDFLFYFSSLMTGTVTALDFAPIVIR